MAYNDVNYYELYSRSFGDELTHYGILGQKWGDRNGPPYPLARRVSNAVTAARNYSDAKREAHIEKAKKKAIASGDSTKIAKQFNNMSAEEVRTALERIELRKKINEIESVSAKTQRDKAYADREMDVKYQELKAREAKSKRDDALAERELKTKNRELKARDIRAKQTTSFISRFANTTATVFGALTPVTQTIANLLGIAKDAATLGKTTAEAVQQASKASAEAQKNAYNEETNSISVETKRRENEEASMRAESLKAIYKEIGAGEKYLQKYNALTNTSTNTGGGKGNGKGNQNSNSITITPELIAQFNAFVEASKNQPALSDE